MSNNMDNIINITSTGIEREFLYMESTEIFLPITNPELETVKSITTEAKLLMLMGLKVRNCKLNVTRSSPKNPIPTNSSIKSSTYYMSTTI